MYNTPVSLSGEEVWETSKGKWDFLLKSSVIYIKDGQPSLAQAMLALKFVCSICGFCHPITVLNEHHHIPKIFGMACEFKFCVLETMIPVS